jgi:hypothetical protein
MGLTINAIRRFMFIFSAKVQNITEIMSEKYINFRLMINSWYFCALINKKCVPLQSETNFVA